AGVTDAGALRPLGMIHTPISAPALGLQLYSTAGAKPTSRLAGDLVRTIALPPSWPTSRVWPAKSASTSNASTHSFVRLYSTAPMSVVLAPGRAWPRKPVAVP